MATPLTDAALRQAYQALLAARAGVEAVPNVSVETIAALAQGTYRGSDRVLLLDRVLADPVTARELQFFRELAAAAPAEPVVRAVPTRWLALAATVALAVGALSVWRVLGPGRDEPVRGGGAVFSLTEPAPGGTLGKGGRLIWRPAPGAQSYRLELVDEGGAAVFATATPDTSATLPDSVRLVSSRGYRVRLVALLRDGTEATAPVSTLIAR